MTATRARPHRVQTSHKSQRHKVTGTRVTAHGSLAHGQHIQARWPRRCSPAPPRRKPLLWATRRGPRRSNCRHRPMALRNWRLKHHMSGPFPGSHLTSLVFKPVARRPPTSCPFPGTAPAPHLAAGYLENRCRLGLLGVVALETTAHAGLGRRAGRRPARCARPTCVRLRLSRAGRSGYGCVRPSLGLASDSAGLVPPCWSSPGSFRRAGPPRASSHCLFSPGWFAPGWFNPTPAPVSPCQATTG